MAADRNIFVVNEKYMPPASGMQWTPAQLNALDELSSRPNFKHWIRIQCSHIYNDPNFRKAGPLWVMYRGVDGKLHSARLGQKKILYES